MLKEVFDKDQQIVKAGEIGSCLYIIKEGTVECSLEGKVVRKLVKGEYFGEMSILLDTDRTLDVITVEPTILYVLSVQTLKKMLGEKFRDAIFLNILINCFMSSVSFNKINAQILEKSYKCFKVLDFPKGSIVVPKGTKESSYIVAMLTGNLVYVKSLILTFFLGKVKQSNSI
jgi:hypothetical protein